MSPEEGTAFYPIALCGLETGFGWSEPLWLPGLIPPVQRGLGVT